MYNEVYNLLNSVHDLVFHKYKIRNFSIEQQHILYWGKNLFVRLDFDNSRQSIYHNNIEIEHHNDRDGLKMPVSDFTKQDYFNQSVIMDIPLSFEDIQHIIKHMITFSENTKRKFRIYIKFDFDLGE